MAPNKRPGADAGWRVLFTFQRPWSRAAQAGRWAEMKHVLTILGACLLLVLTGCSGSADPLAGYEHGKGDLRDFIVRAAPQLGVHLLQTSSLPVIPGRLHHQAGRDELAVVMEGDCFPHVHSFLTNAVGPAQGNSTADKTTGVQETYYGTNLTATVCCRSGITDGGKKYTSLVIVGYGAAAGKQAGYAQLLREAVEKANDSHRALDVARPSAPYVSLWRLPASSGTRVESPRPRSILPASGDSVRVSGRRS